MLVGSDLASQVAYSTRLERQFFEQTEGPVDALDGCHRVLRSVEIPALRVVVRGLRWR